MSQRYRLTWEFTLEHPKDYHTVKSHLEAVLARVAEHTMGFAPDYLAIEKVKEEPKS